MNEILLSKRLKHITLFCAFLLLFCSTVSIAQTFQVTGSVKDDMGEELPGANIAIKGTQSGAIADVNGNFTLNQVSASSVLVFSFIGFTPQEVTVGNQRVFNIVLNTDNVLEEVVVTALGITRERRALAYSVAEVNTDDIVAANALNPVLALQGRAAGVSVSGGAAGGSFSVARIQIRGVSTISGNNTQPIYVVDGVILENSVTSYGGYTTAGDMGNQLKNLNPEDFESVTVLKGAASTALYGSRGLYGAVVITTKKAATGRQNLGISVSQTTGVDWVYGSPEFQTVYGPGGAAGSSAIEDGQNPWLPNFGYRNYGTADQFPTLQRMPRSQYSGNWGPKYDGRQIEDYIDGRMIPYSPYDDFFTGAFDLGVNSSTNVSISGGNENTSFYLSGNYTYRKGTYTRNDFDRTSFLFRGSHKLSSFLSAEGSISFAETSSLNPPEGELTNNFQRSQWKPIYNSKFYKDKWQTTHGGTPSTSYNDEYANIPGVGTWWSRNNRNREEKQMMIIAIARLTANISDFTFIAEGNMPIVYTTENRKYLGTGYGNEGTTSATGGQYFLNQNMSRRTTLKVTGAYRKSVGDFDLGGTIGGEWFYNHGRVATEVSTVDGLVAPGQYFIGNSRSLRSNSGSDQNKKRISSLFFLANLSWKRQVYVDITGRNDWSSALVYSNGSGNYSYFYPSVGTSWIFTETFQMPSWFTYGKLKASWAQVGNDTGTYSINTTYSANSVEMPNATLVQRQTFGRTMIDPRLKPERKNAIEGGLELMFVDNRFGIDFTYYKENTKDQIIDIAAPLESGVNSQRVNAGNIQNQGVEIVLKGTPVRGAFNWDIDIMFAKNMNKIVELHPEVGEYMELVNASGDYRVRSVAYVGGDYGTLISDVLPKKDPKTGKTVLVWNEGRKVAYPQRDLTMQKVGKIEPDFTGSMTNSFSWKGISASVLLDFRWGGYIASYTNLYAQGYGATQNSLKYRDSEHGGMTFTSIHDEKYRDGHNGVFHDGYIPDGVFQEGTKIRDAKGGADIDVAGMSFQEAYELGIVDPVHASTYYAFAYEWGTFTLDDSWFSKVKYIGLRQVTLGYTIPRQFTNRLGISNLRVAIEAQNLGYLYNSLPNKLNPQSVGGNANNTFMERLLIPYTASYNFSLRFNI